MTLSTAELINTFGMDVDPQIDREDIIPVHKGLQFQGDVAVVPATGAKAATTAVPTAGFPVVRGESNGNTHLLLPSEGVFFDSNSNVSAVQLSLGTLTVADGAQAFLHHPEHGYLGIAPGSYQIRRQREEAETQRLVQD